MKRNKRNEKRNRKSTAAETAENDNRNVEDAPVGATKAADIQRALTHWRWRLLSFRLKHLTTRLATLMAAFFVGGVAVAARADEAETSNQYFLNTDQKLELITRGEITGDDGTVYGVRVVPGFVPPVESARDSFMEAGEQFDDYADAETYRGMGKSYEEGTDFIAHDMIQEMIVKGVGDSWRDSMKSATETTRNLAVGWPLAYPWAVTKSTTETAGRLAIGGVGSGAGTAYYYALEPAGKLVFPGIAGTIVALGGGVALPAAKVAFNTVVAPPLALTAGVPTPDRADGYFVQIVKAAPKAIEAPKSETSSKVGDAKETSQVEETLNAGGSQEIAGCCVFVDMMMREQMAAWAADAANQAPAM